MFGIQVYLNDRILFEMAKFVMQMQRGNERDATWWILKPPKCDAPRAPSRYLDLKLWLDF